MLVGKRNVAAGIITAAIATVIASPLATAAEKTDEPAPPKIVIGDAMADLTRVSFASPPDIKGVRHKTDSKTDDKKKLNWSSGSMSWSKKSDSSSLSDELTSLDRFISSTRISEHAEKARSDIRDGINQFLDFVLPSDGTITSGFGQRWGTNHNGVDFAAPLGADIKSFADGKVIDAGPASGFGNWIRILHGDGSMTVYGHMSVLDVSVGDKVRAGDIIAKVGNEGFSTGPHLHFEYYPDGPNGSPIDPMGILKEKNLI